MFTLLAVAAVAITVFFAGQSRPAPAALAASFDADASAASFHANWTTIRS